MGVYRTPRSASGMSATMISALKITALRMALCGVASFMMFSGAMAGNVAISIAGMMAKYLATSLAMLKVVSDPRVMSICFPISTISSKLGRIAVEIHHIAGFAGGLRSGVHRNAHVGLRQRRGVVGSVAQSWPQDDRRSAHRGCAAVSVPAWPAPCSHPRPPQPLWPQPSAGLSPVIMTVRMPILRRWAKRSWMPPLTTSLR